MRSEISSDLFERERRSSSADRIGAGTTVTIRSTMPPSRQGPPMLVLVALLLLCQQWTAAHPLQHSTPPLFDNVFPVDSLHDSLFFLPVIPNDARSTLYQLGYVLVIIALIGCLVPNILYVLRMLISLVTTRDSGQMSLYMNELMARLWRVLLFGVLLIGVSQIPASPEGTAMALGLLVAFLCCCGCTGR